MHSGHGDWLPIFNASTLRTECELDFWMDAKHCELGRVFLFSWCECCFNASLMMVWLTVLWYWLLSFVSFSYFDGGFFSMYASIALIPRKNFMCWSWSFEYYLQWPWLNLNQRSSAVWVNAMLYLFCGNFQLTLFFLLQQVCFCLISVLGIYYCDVHSGCCPEFPMMVAGLEYYVFISQQPVCEFYFPISSLYHIPFWNASNPLHSLYLLCIDDAV